MPGVTTDLAPPEVAAVPAAPGALIADRYRLESRLGAGGGGTVWRCTDEKLAAVVALKIVGSGGDVERWRREVAMARRIADRNVCRVHDLGETAELRFVTMELIEGRSLRASLGPDLAPAEARALFAQIVAGTAAIHAAGVVHRDLKPENIVVATDGRAVIVDFGLAREPRMIDAAVTVTDEAPAQTGVVGTPRYMSPEQAAGAPVDVRTDVWALGLIGHELLCGALPELVHGAPVVAAAIDERYQPILRRCLAASPGARFADARALAAALAAVGHRRPRRTLGILAATAAVAGIALATAYEPAARPVAPFGLQQITSTERSWPAGGAMSVALSPDARRIAYSTGDGKLYVRDLDAAAAQAWPSPKRTDRDADLFVTSWAAGWFADGSLAQLGATRDGEWQLLHVARDGQTRVVYRNPQRFTAAVSIRDDVAIGIDDYAVFVLPATGGAPNQIATIGRGEQVMAVAWSPAGDRLALARMPADAQLEAIVQVMTAGGAEIREVWRGQTSIIVDSLLAWLDPDRLVFSHQDPQTKRTTLSAIDVATRASTDRELPGAEYAGIGSAARGVVVMLRGTARYTVQLGDKFGEHLAPLHDDAVQGSQVAGWTTDGHVVFAAGQPGALQIVRAIPGTPPAPWPGTQRGVDRADTVVDDSVIVHHAEGDKAIVDRIGPTGERVRLAEVPVGPDPVVRCAGDHAPPCVLVETDTNTVRFIQLDPVAGARGAVIHQRPARERYMRDLAVSPDGEQLAIVDGGDQVTVIDIATGNTERAPSAGVGAALQSIGYGARGELWATSIGYRGKLFGLMSFSRMGDHFVSSPLTRGPARDAMRWYWRPAPSPDGTHVALVVREFHLEAWRIDGL